MEAYMAAKAASDAAAAAATSAAAQAQQAVAEAEQGDAADALADAEMYAGMVQVAQDALDEAAALTAARDGAQAAADAARAAATTAQEAADKVAELAGDGSSQATATQADATAADTAATAAEAANTAAQAAETSDVAAGHQADAESAQADAMTSQTAAAEKQREAQVASNVASEQQEARDIEAAQNAAGEAATAAQVSYGAAKDAATTARGEADDAKAAAERAGRARTKVGTEDDPGAQAAAQAADDAATAAEAARDAALEAMNAANAANTDAMGATTSDDAEMYQGNVETAQAEAAAAATTASTESGNAETAAENAETAANTHVLELFMQANAYDIDTDMLDMDMDTVLMTVDQLQIAERNSVGGALAISAVAAGGDRDGDIGATVDWAPDADPDMPTLALTGTLVGNDAETAMSTTDIPGFTGFENAFSHMRPRTVGEDGVVTDSGNSQVLAFTDKGKETAEVTAASAAVLRNVPVDSGENVEALGDSTDGGKTYPGTFDSSDTEVEVDGLIMGTFTCAGDPDSCTVVYTGTGDDRTITEFDGFTFSGTRAEVEAAPADLQEDYLVFGIWLQEADGEAGTDTFGAFYGGGTDYSIDADVEDAITGTATYRGAAVGAHHITAGPVSYFDGRATLIAKFGNAIDEAGTIEGSIDNIRLHGEDYGDVIRLVQTSLDGTQAGVFNGSAVMDPQTEPGQASHSYNGTYSGQFFGASAEIIDDPETDVVDETVAAGARAPAAVAGSFGVTRSMTMGEGDDAMTTVESFVGAFGARQAE
jgi:hypothetical protein